MARIVTTTLTREGYLRSICLRRTGDGKITVQIVVSEVDSENGVPVSSRERVFTRDDLTPLQRDNLLALFDSAESRIRTLFYA